MSTTPSAGIVRRLILLFSLMVASAYADCCPPPSGLVAWWQAESNFINSVDGNSGTRMNSGAFVQGRVGTGFFFQGSDAVLLGDPTNLHLQNFTIETWVKRAHAGIATTDNGSSYGSILSWGYGGYVLKVLNDGRFGIEKSLAQTFPPEVISSTLRVTDTNFHHLAVSKTGSNVVFYLDGVSEMAAPFDPGFTFNTLTIGAWIASTIKNFYGMIDELSVYNRALSPEEIHLLYNSGSAGKCPMPPAFLQTLPNRGVTVGSNVVLNAQLGGSQPMNQQWFFNGLPLIDDAHISGSTSTALAISNSQTNLSGNYYLVASNCVGVSTSSIAHVSIGFPPFIEQPPISQSIENGSNVIFAVVSTGDAPLSYHWRFNGSDILASSRISGVGTSMLTISNLTTADIGNYDVIITNSIGSVTSTVATLFVMTEAPVIVTDPTNLVALYGKSTTFTALVSGLDLSYHWQKDGMDLFDLGRLSGAQTSALTISNIQVSDIGAYRLVASNELGVAFTTEADLSVVPIAVWGVTNYGEANVASTLTNAIAIASQGWNAENLSVGLKSDRTVAGWGNGANFYIPQIGLSNILTISTGIRHFLALKSDFSVVGLGDNSFGQTNIPNNLGPVAVAGAGLLHNLLLKSDATLIGWGSEANPPVGFFSGISNIVAISPGFFHSLAIRSDGTVVGWGDVGFGQTNPPSGLSNVVAVSAGNNYSVALKSDGTVVAWGSNAKGVVPPGLSNVVAIAAGVSHTLALKSDGTVVAWGSNTLAEATYIAGLSNVVEINASHNRSVALMQSPAAQALPVTWWQGLTNRIILAGQNTVFIPAFSGSGPITFQWYYADAPMLSQTNRWLVLNSLQPEQSGDYKVVLSNSMGSTTSSITRLQIGNPPTWVLQPTSQTNIAGNSTQFVATVAGSEPLSYQWYFNSNPLSNGARLSGVTNATLTITNLLTTDAGSYTVRVTNLFGSITSTVASLTILVPPNITTQPLSRTNQGCVNVTFSVTATGTSPLRYFWHKNGQPIPGATSFFYQLFDVRRTNEGIYSVLVTNSAGVISSSNAVLRVLMAQRFQTSSRSADGSISFISSDYDGGLIPESDLTGFEASASTNLVNWEPLTNALSITNGMLLLLDPSQSNYLSRFYRIIER
jgi:hypothetical protein